MTRHRRCHLVLVDNPKINTLDDFRRIAGYVREATQDVIPVVLPKRRISHARRLWLARRPTFVFSPMPFRRPRLYRGAVYKGVSLLKSEEYAALDAAGLPVPPWTLLTRDRQPDLAEFGPYVVIKPDRGGRGANVRIKRRGRVRWKRPAEASGRTSDWIVQEFVYTGPWPVSHRVTTLFGEVLHAWRSEADHDRRPLGGRYDFGEHGGISIVASHQGCTFTLEEDEEIQALARRAAAAFPDIPLLGVDVLRERPSGRLFVVEVNAIGMVWAFSGRVGTAMQEYAGFRLESQYDGIRKAATVLAREARARAR